MHLIWNLYQLLSYSIEVFHLYAIVNKIIEKNDVNIQKFFVQEIISVF